MRIKNYTPFPMLCYEGRGVDDAPFDTLVVRVTMDLGSRRVLRLAEEQTPLAGRAVSAHKKAKRAAAVEERRAKNARRGGGGGGER